MNKDASKNTESYQWPDLTLETQRLWIEWIDAAWAAAPEHWDTMPVELQRQFVKHLGDRRKL